MHDVTIDGNSNSIIHPVRGFSRGVALILQLRMRRMPFSYWFSMVSCFGWSGALFGASSFEEGVLNRIMKSASSSPLLNHCLPEWMSNLVDLPQSFDSIQLSNRTINWEATASITHSHTRLFFRSIVKFASYFSFTLSNANNANGKSGSRPRFLDATALRHAIASYWIDFKPVG